MEITHALKILSNAEKARVQGLKNACDLLQPRSRATELLEQIVRKSAFDQNSLELLKKVAPVVQACHVQKRITDWPFENFWGDPHEPRHSQLLGYFIDPHEKHGAGEFLLKRFFAAIDKDKTVHSLQPSGDMTARDLIVDTEHCMVRCENGYIDVLITRDGDDLETHEKYAVIIENKVHGASDQEGQLCRYVRKARLMGFGDAQIYVVYLPLTGDAAPAEASLCFKGDHIKSSQVVTVNFCTHIRNWLNGALNAPLDEKRLGPEMRDNLKHYLNFVNYLLTQEKELKMQQQILAMLQDAKMAGTFPTWEEVVSLRTSVEELEKCYKAFIRGKLLLEVQRLLDKRGLKPKFYCSNEKPEVDSPHAHDSRFLGEMNVGIRIKDIVVCVGASSDSRIVWTGYMATGKKDDGFIEIAKNHNDGKKDPWYGWKWEKEMTYEKCQTAASGLAEEVEKMCHNVEEYIATQQG